MTTRLTPGRGRPLLIAAAVLLAACTTRAGRDAAAGGDTRPASTAPAGPAAAAPPTTRPLDPRVWAGVSAAVPGGSTNAVFRAGQLDRLMVGVALVNDGPDPLPFDAAATRLVVNGVPAAIFDGNGPVWDEVERGRPYEAAAGVGRLFARPGVYRVQWVGAGFASAVLEFRVLPDR